MMFDRKRGLLAAVLCAILVLSGCSTDVVVGEASPKYPMPKLADPDNIPELDPLDDTPSWDDFLSSVQASVKRGQKNGSVGDVSRLADIVDKLEDADHDDPGVQAVMRTVMRLAYNQSQEPALIEESGKKASDGELEWTSCGDEGLECASLEVPLDYDDPNGETIEIKIDRYKARKESERIGVLYSNPGGPGGSGVDFLPSWYGDLSDDIKDKFDVISFDPRGVGQSDPIVCGQVNSSADPNPYPHGKEQEDEYTEYATDTANACKKAEPLLDHVGSVNVALDMDEMRKAMGEDQINFVGYSYGTVIGQVYASMFPDKVRAFVLDGVVDTGLTKQELSSKQNSAFDNALRRFAKSCADVCTGLAQYVTEQAAQSPYTSAYLDAGSEVDDYVAQVGILGTLYSKENWPLLSWGLREAAVNGDGTLLRLAAENYAGISIFDGGAAGGSGGGGDDSFSAVMCEDFDVSSLEDAYEMARTDNRLHPVFANSPDVLCNVWPSEREPLGPITWADNTPVLLVSTTGDPATPHSMAQSVVSRNPSSVLLTHKGDGHTVYGGSDSCVDDYVNAFLLDEDMPPKGSVCE